MKTPDTYSFAQHLHNFAVWTASRAVQRNFTTTKIIREAIETTELRSLLNENKITTQEAFDEFHKANCRKLIKAFARHHIKASYGRAAKILAVYLKTSVIVMDKGETVFSRIAHPPIDRILLHNLSKKHKEMGFHSLNWTALNEKEYFNLIAELRKLQPDYFWKMEKYWKPEIA